MSDAPSYRTFKDEFEVEQHVLSRLGMADREFDTIVAWHKADFYSCANYCDKVLDKSGGLLGIVRSAARRQVKDKDA